MPMAGHKLNLRSPAGFHKASLSPPSSSWLRRKVEGRACMPHLAGLLPGLSIPSANAHSSLRQRGLVNKKPPGQKMVPVVASHWLKKGQYSKKQHACGRHMVTIRDNSQAGFLFRLPYPQDSPWTGLPENCWTATCHSPPDACRSRFLLS